MDIWQDSSDDDLDDVDVDYIFGPVLPDVSADLVLEDGEIESQVISNAPRPGL